MSFAGLTPEQFINLGTTKKSGAVVMTPVWFVLDTELIFVMTGKDAGKVKRIRHTPLVTVAACDRAGNVLGPQLRGIARVLDEADYSPINTLMNKKYGLMKRMFDLMATFNGGVKNRAFIEIRPEA